MFINTENSFSINFISKMIDLVHFENKDLDILLNIIFLILFSFRYISSFETKKIFNWFGNVKYFYYLYL
jgi:hypothetical protein